MTCKNPSLKVVKNPTKYKGGISESPKVVTHPTKYTGGKNKGVIVKRGK